jgi:hypothetical protein
VRRELLGATDERRGHLVRVPARQGKHAALDVTVTDCPMVHQMILSLERVGLIRRQSGVARTIEILIPPEKLPILEWLKINPSKSL